MLRDAKLRLVEKAEVRSIHYPKNLGRGSILVEHKVGNNKAGLGKAEGRGRVCREETVVGSKPRSRPRRLLSKGVRIYSHYRDGVVKRTSWNVDAGILRAEILAHIYSVKAIGSEEGAMVVHFSHPWSTLDIAAGKLMLGDVNTAAVA